MELQHINIKVFVEGELQVDPSRFINVFHEWIKTQALEELLIDVADYRHVPAGPSVLLVGHEADYGLDHTGNRYGLRYNRKAPIDGSNENRIKHAFRSAIHACQLLETEFADNALKFNRQEIEFSINDRAIAPNTPESFNSIKPELESYLENLLGHRDFSLEHIQDPRKRFAIHIKMAEPIDFGIF